MYLSKEEEALLREIWNSRNDARECPPPLKSRSQWFKYFINFINSGETGYKNNKIRDGNSHNLAIGLEFGCYRRIATSILVVKFGSLSTVGVK